MRLRGKVDANHASIVRELRLAGASVLSLADIGNGAPDIVAALRGQTALFEIKDGNLPPSKKRLTPMEKLFHDNWRGRIAVIETAEEALKILG